MGYIQSGKSKVEIVNVSETVTSAANVSQYPVESGAPITDNMMYTGGPVTISGWILAKMVTLQSKLTIHQLHGKKMFVGLFIEADHILKCSYTRYQ